MLRGIPVGVIYINDREGRGLLQFSLSCSLLQFSLDYCISFLAGLPQSLISKLQRVQNYAFRLAVRAPPHINIIPISRHHWLPVRARICYRIECLCFNAITSSVCTLRLDLSPPVPTPASSKFHSISEIWKVIVLSLTLVLLSGTHCHCTLELPQLLTPSSPL